MDEFNNEELEKAILTIKSIIKRSEDIKNKFKEGTSQSSLVRNRLNAMYISLALISNELHKTNDSNTFTEEDLKRALPPIVSTINKCERVKMKLNERTHQAKQTQNLLDALNISLSLISKALMNK